MTIVNIHKIPRHDTTTMASTLGITHAFRIHLTVPSGQAFKEKVDNCLLKFQSSLSEGCGSLHLSSEDGGS